MALEFFKRKAEKLEKTDFEKQFVNREQIKTAGGVADVIDIKPETLADPVPVYFAPGLGVSTEVYKPSYDTLAKQGREVIAYDPPRFGGEGIQSEAEKALRERFGEELVLKALNLRDVMTHKNIEKIDVIAHSAGAVEAVIAAYMHPEKFRSLMLFGPAGMIGEDSAGRLWKGFNSQGNPKPTLDALPPSPDVGQEERERTETAGGVPIQYPKIEMEPETQKAVSNVMKDFGKYVLKNPAGTVDEWLGLASAQMDDLIADIRSKGVKVGVISAVDDPVYPVKKMIGKLNDDGSITPGQIKKEQFDAVLSVRGGHGQLGDNPERYVVAANQMLEKLRDRSNKISTDGN